MKTNMNHSDRQSHRVENSRMDHTTRRNSRPVPTHLAITCALALAALTFSPSTLATSSDVEEALQRMAVAEGAAYESARDALLATAAMHAPLRERLRRATYADDTWVADAMVLTLIAHLDDPNAGRALDDIGGIDPRVYEGFRRPEPIAGRELVARRVAPGVLVEAFMKTSRLRRYVDAAREEPALRRALLVALTDSRHAIARPFLADVVRRGGSLDERASAAVLLGDLGAEGVRDLSTVAHDTRQPNEVRTAALIGLGRTRTRAALEILVDECENGRDLERTDAAIRALGVVGDAWATDAAPAKDAALIRLRATATLVGLLPAASGTVRVDLIGLSLATIADESAMELLDAHIAAGGQRAEDATRVKRRVARALARRR